MASHEMERNIQEIWALFRETNKRFEETDKRFKDISEELRRDFQETRKLVKETSNMVGDLGGRWGHFIEGMLIPAAQHLFLERGLPVHDVSPRRKRFKDGRRMEIDLLVLNSGYALVVEAKSHLSLKRVDEFLLELDEFKDFFPEYKDCIVHGAVAGIVVDEGVDKYAYRKGLYVIGQSGEYVKILNDKKFKPKEW